MTCSPITRRLMGRLVRSAIMPTTIIGNGTDFVRRTATTISNAGSVKLVYDVSNDSRFVLTLDAYDEEHGEPGGLRTTVDPAFPPDRSVLYQVDRNATSRFFDRFRLKRYYAMLEYQKLFSEHTELDIKAFGGYLSRYSKRQRGGGVGVMPDPNPAPGSPSSTNSIQLREDWTEGAELRLRHDYALAGDTSTFAGGVYFYHALQDRDDSRGTTPDADSGDLRNFTTGETTDFAIFAENRFHFGRFSITPGMRLEFLWQSLDETFNITRPANLLTRDDSSFVPLFSLGVGYVLVEGQHPVETTAERRQGREKHGDDHDDGRRWTSASRTLRHRCTSVSPEDVRRIGPDQRGRYRQWRSQGGQLSSIRIGIAREAAALPDLRHERLLLHLR